MNQSGSSGCGRRLAPGDAIRRRELSTIQEEPVSVPAPGVLTHLQFRRFAGCPICNVHLRSVARRHDEIVDAGVHEVVFFHSTTESMLPYQGDLPFATVADPDKELYAEFGVESSRRANLHPKAWTSPLKPQAWSVVARGFRAGSKPGAQGESMLGLPADFLIGSDGYLLAAHYGSHANDQWSVDEILNRAAGAVQRTDGD